MRENIVFIFFVVLTLGYKESGFCALGIKGTSHDFTRFAWANYEICQACHTPHNASVATAPLWNRASTQQVFIPYKSSTMKATVGQPDGGTKLCLSCHDGTVALDAYGGANPPIASDNSNKIGDFIGPDLNRFSGHPLKHPLSFVFDSNLVAVDNRLIDPNLPQVRLDGATVRSKLLFLDKVQCSSCHDVHNRKGYENLLRLPMEKDSLCLACHKKI